MGSPKKRKQLSNRWHFRRWGVVLGALACLALQPAAIAPEHIAPLAPEPSALPARSPASDFNLDPLIPGDLLTIEGTQYQVERRLSAGGIKTNYVVRELSCSDHCIRVVGVYHSEFIDEGRLNLPANEQVATSIAGHVASPHVRMERPRVAAVIQGRPTEVAFSEYAMGTLVGLSRSNPTVTRDPAILRVLAEQLYSAIGSFHRRGLVHLDLKPDNILIMGDPNTPISAESILSGRHYFVLADHDVVVRRNMEPDGMARGTPSFMAPEQVHARILSPDTGSSVWATSLTLWRLHTGQSLLEHPELVLRRIPQRLQGLPFYRPADIDALRGVVRTQMAEEIAVLRAAGQHERADRLATLAEIILNGLHWEANRRALRLPPTTDGAEAAITRFRNVRNDYGTRLSGRRPMPGIILSGAEAESISSCLSLPSVLEFLSIH